MTQMPKWLLGRSEMISGSLSLLYSDTQTWTDGQYLIILEHNREKMKINKTQMTI